MKASIFRVRSKVSFVDINIWNQCYGTAPGVDLPSAGGPPRSHEGLAVLQGRCQQLRRTGGRRLHLLLARHGVELVELGPGLLQQV